MWRQGVSQHLLLLIVSLPQPRHPRAIRVARVAILLALPIALVAQRYDSMSATEVQRRLKIPRKTLYDKLARHSLRPADFRRPAERRR